VRLRRRLLLSRPPRVGGGVRPRRRLHAAARPAYPWRTCDEVSTNPRRCLAPAVDRRAKGLLRGARPVPGTVV